MARRPPLTLGDDGLPQRLQSGDTLPCNVRFTGTATLPALTVLSLFGTVDVTVTPVVPGDALVAGEHISVMPAADLPGGLNIAFARATGPTTVRIGLSAVVAVALSTMTFSVVAHR